MIMANAKLIFTTYNAGGEDLNNINSRFTISIPDDAKILRYNFAQLRALAIANNPNINKTKLDEAISKRQFFKISPVNFNVPIDVEEPDILDNRLTTIDYNGVKCSCSDSKDIFCSADETDSLYGAEIVKNIVIRKTAGKMTTGGSANLKEFYGDIIVNGGHVSLFKHPCKIQKAVGTLELTNVTSFNLCTANSVGESGHAMWFNVIDIRNVDTSSCTSMEILNNVNTPCTIIVGNFSNENMSYNDLFMRNAPRRGRVLVLTTEVPPVLKNCSFKNGVPQNAHSNTYDWVAKGKFERILVPEAYEEAYQNNVYTNGTVGNTGWSYYGKHGGKDIIRTYNPARQYLVKKEGGENGRPIWIYRKSNR